MQIMLLFSKTVQLGVKYGAELILIETMNDSYETKAALLAVKENSDLPVFVSNAYGEDGKLKGIMAGIFKAAHDTAEEFGQPGNYVMGGNIAGFRKVADSMIEQGVM